MTEDGTSPQSMSIRSMLSLERGIMPVGNEDVTAKDRIQARQLRAVSDCATTRASWLMKFGRNPQVLGDEVGRQAVLVGRRGKVAVGDEAVNIFFFQPGIFDGIGRRFQMETERRSSRNALCGVYPTPTIAYLSFMDGIVKPPEKRDKLQ